MKIERGSAHSSYAYWTVLVDPNEVVVDSGKTLPYSTWIGTVDENGKINVWTPAAYVPRGYKRAALALLEEARRKLQNEGLVTMRRSGKHR